jgi:hypothetical protein
MNVHRLSHFRPGGGFSGKAEGDAENPRVDYEIGREIAPEIGQGVFFEIRLCKSVSVH